jgi:hypothetical protein
VPVEPVVAGLCDALCPEELVAPEALVPAGFCELPFGTLVAPCAAWALTAPLVPAIGSWALRVALNTNIVATTANGNRVSLGILRGTSCPRSMPFR